MNAPSSIIAVIRPFQKPAPAAVEATRGNSSRNWGITRMIDTTPWLILISVDSCIIVRPRLLITEEKTARGRESGAQENIVRAEETTKPYLVLGSRATMLDLDDYLPARTVHEFPL